MTEINELSTSPTDIFRRFSSDDYLHDRRLRLAEEFHDALVASQRFSWMGIFKTIDELNMPWLVFMLSEKKSPREPLFGNGSIGEELAELSLAYRPNLTIGLYYLREKEPENPAEIAEEAVRNRFSWPSHIASVNKLFEEQL